MFADKIQSCNSHNHKDDEDKIIYGVVHTESNPHGDSKNHCHGHGFGNEHAHNGDHGHGEGNHTHHKTAKKEDNDDDHHNEGHSFESDCCFSDGH